MSELATPWRVAVLRTVGAVAVAAVVAGVAALVMTGHGDQLWPVLVGPMALAAAFLAVFTWLVAPHQGDNPVVLIMAIAAASSACYVVSSTVAVLVVADDPELAAVVLSDSIAPVELPTIAAWARALGDGVASGGFLLWLTLGLLLFPDGLLPSRRWRPLAWLSVAFVALTAGSWVVKSLPGSIVAYSDGLWFNAGLVGVMLCAPACLASVMARLRNLAGPQRDQVKWVMWGAAVLVPFILVAIALEQGSVTAVFFLLGEMAMMGAYGIAVGRYRVFDVDVVISRTVLYGVMAAFITVIYIVIAVGLGGAVGGSSLWPSVVATATVAVVFEPARRRVQRWANRLVYGTRATPYEVLSEVTGRMSTAESTEGLLDRMAAVLAAGTGAARAAVWVAEPSGLVVAAQIPAGEDEWVQDIDGLPGEWAAIEHDGAVLGAFTVEKPRGEALSATERGLLDDLAGSAALVLRKLRLSAALEAKAEALTDSRRRLVDAQDAERRRLERALHDGAQQTVVGLKVKLDLARQAAAEEGLEPVAALLDQMSNETQVALDDIRLLARGVYPPLLQAEGLAIAVPALADASPLEASCSVVAPHRLPLNVEAAVYFCVSEAITNAAKHAAGPLSVEVAGDDEAMSFAVKDGGPGFDPASVPLGSGLRNMADRLESLGGRLEIDSSPGSPTTVTGWLPVGLVAVG